jgi:hypothetical protein
MVYCIMTETLENKEKGKNYESKVFNKVFTTLPEVLMSVKELSTEHEIISIHEFDKVPRFCLVEQQNLYNGEQKSKIIQGFNTHEDAKKAQEEIFESLYNSLICTSEEPYDRWFDDKRDDVYSIFDESAAQSFIFYIHEFKEEF